MHEENYIELDNVTIGDCLDGYNYKNRRIVVNVVILLDLWTKNLR